MDLSSARHALVTGGASGIGLGIVNALSERGIAVTIADLDRSSLDAEFTDRSGDFLPLDFDTRDRDGWANVKRQAEAKFGPVDILVNNAGIGPDGREFVDMKPEAFDRMVAVNLTAVFNGVSAFAADMRTRGNGHIVNTSSSLGLSLGYSGMGAYSATKFGVVALSEALRAELDPYGVGVSVLCPGPVASNLGRTTRNLGNEMPENRLPNGIVRMTGIKTGRIVMRSIELNLPYIITHPNYWGSVQQRTDLIQESFQAAEKEWPAIPG